ncbi:hypothetical protein PM082_019919 [Marasmius tenuissimus]|nr:hypothetical protein PM082_019919 [Marasmius tenuissimus]
MASSSIKHYAVSQDVFYIPNFVTEEEEKYLVRKILDSPRHKWKNLANRRLQLLGGQLTSKNILIPEAFPPFIGNYPDIITRLKSTGVFQDSPHGSPNHIILNEYLPGQGIMPHEDGPAYHPVVATISLGSHTMFHYYRYKPDRVEADLNGLQEHGGSEAPEGRTVDPTPVLTVLLEPRSVVITTGDFYRNHLHGISGLAEDTIVPGVTENSVPRVTVAEDTENGDTRVEIANWRHLSESSYTAGRRLERGARYSLTCRDVLRVSRATPAASLGFR